jgi:hypothetical protein
VQKICVRILVNPAIRKKDEGLDPFRLLKVVDLNVVLYEVEDIDVGREVAALQTIVETELADELLKDYVIIRHHLLAHVAGQRHHFANDVLQLHVLY